MGIDNFTNRQLDFMVRYIGNLLLCIKSLRDERKNSNKMKQIGKGIQKQLGIYNEKGLKEFSLFIVTGISTEETLSILNYLNITNQSIIPTDASNKICAIRNDDYMKFCECCDSIKNGEIDLDDLLKDFREKQGTSYTKEEINVENDAQTYEEIPLNEEELAAICALKQQDMVDIGTDYQFEEYTNSAEINNVILSDCETSKELENIELVDNNYISDEATNKFSFDEISEKDKSIDNGYDMNENSGIINGTIETSIDAEEISELSQKENSNIENATPLSEDSIAIDLEEKVTIENEIKLDDTIYDEEQPVMDNTKETNNTNDTKEINENEYTKTETNDKSSIESNAINDVISMETKKQEFVDNSNQFDSISTKDGDYEQKSYDFEDKDKTNIIANDNNYEQINDKEQTIESKNSFDTSSQDIDNYQDADITKVSIQENTVLDFNTNQTRTVNENMGNQDTTSNDYNFDYRDNYKKETQQQQAIMNSQLEQRTANESATVTHVGNGNSIEQHVSNANNNSSSDELEFKGINGNVYNTNQQKQQSPGKNYDITINRVSLVHGSNTEINKKIINSSGELVLAPMALGVLDTSIYAGCKEVKGLTSMFSGSLSKASENAAINSQLKKYQTELDNRSLKTFDTFIQNKGFSALDYKNLKAGRESMESIYRTLEGSGLARFNAKTKTYDHSSFNKLLKSYKNGDKTPLIKALKFSEKTPMTDIELVINQLDKKIKANKPHNTMKDKNVKKSKKSLKSKGKKILQNNAAFNGYQEIAQTVTTARTAYTLLRASGSAVKSGYRSLYKKIGNACGSHSKAVQKNVNKKINKWVTQEQKKRNKLGEKAAKKKNKTDRKVAKKVTRREEHKKNLANTARSIIGKNNYDNLRKQGRRAVEKKRVLVNKIKSSKVAKVFNGLGGIKNTILKAINPIEHLANFIKTKIILFCGIFMIGYMLIAGGIVITAAAVIAVLDFFDISSDQNTDESDMGIMVNNLIELESRWTNELTDKDKLSGIGLDQITYTNNYLEIEEYAKQMEYQYDNSLRAIQSVEPFANIVTKSDFKKWLNKIDGGIEIVYNNASGGTTRTCNIKEIISMAAVYFDNNSDFEEEESMPDEEYKGIFTGFFKKISVMLQSGNQKKNTVSNYCVNLFNISHRESYELENIIMPTKLAVENASGESGLPVENASIEMCPSNEFDGYGCKQYEDFGYRDDGIICIKDINDVLQPVNLWSYPKEKDTCVMSNNGELEYQITNFRDCYSISVSKTGEGGSAGGCGGSLEAAVKSANGDIKNVSQFSVNGINSASASAISGDKTRKIYNPGYDPNLPDGYGNNRYRTETYHDNYTVTINRNCAGDHTAYYCAGHLKAFVTGNIYGFTDEQVGDENTNALVGKLANNEYVHKDVSSLTIDTSKLSKLVDIFDCDGAMIHPSESKLWDGWTKGNMELAILKYQQDWEELYEITINSVLGGKGLSFEDTEKIIEAIEKEYPGLSEERKEVIKRAMGYVGNIGYSQKHHPCPLDGPCRLNKSSRCGLSDCSGFVSDLWSSKLGTIHTTYSFKTTYKSIMKPFRVDTAIPGDIALHYGVNSAGETNNHAVLYIGKFKYNGQTEPWTIDCTSMNGAGNVFLRSYFRLNTCLNINADQL